MWGKKAKLQPPNDWGMHQTCQTCQTSSLKLRLATRATNGKNKYQDCGQVLCQKIIEHRFDTLTYINIMKLERLAASDASACLDESLAELCTSQILAVGTAMSWRRAAGSHFCPNPQQNNHACVGLCREINSKYIGNM